MYAYMYISCIYVYTYCTRKEYFAKAIHYSYRSKSWGLEPYLA